MWPPTGSTRSTTRTTRASDRLGTQWLQSLLDIQDETRDAAEFWDHVKVDLFPGCRLRLHAQEPDHGHCRAVRRWSILPTPSTAMWAIRTVGCAHQRRSRCPCAPNSKMAMWWRLSLLQLSAPNPAWLSFVRTGTRALQNSPPPENHGAHRVRDPGRAHAGAGLARRRHRYIFRKRH